MAAFLAKPSVWLADYAAAFTRLSEAPLRRQFSPLALQLAAASAALAVVAAAAIWRLWWKRRV